jgi:hypothetical protein
MAALKDVTLGTESCGECINAAARAGAHAPQYCDRLGSVVARGFATQLRR